MIWVTFFISAAILVLASIKLAEYGDAIAYRTKLGGLFVGTLLMAGATSLPEFLTSINSLQQGVLGLAAGNMMGSNMFNMALVGLLGLIFYKQRVLRRVAMRHTLTASLATALIGLATFFILADIDVKIGWIGLDSLLLIVAYIGGVWLIRSNGPDNSGAGEEELEDDSSIPKLPRALIGFSLATLVLVLVSPYLVRSSADIAEITGLGTGFVGTALLALITSLPELITALVAARLGAYDLALGNLFGSNLFNIFTLGVTDVFYLQGRFLGAIDPQFALTGLLGLLLTAMGLIGNQARLERRIWLVEIDALLLVVGYFLGLWLLYTRGIGI
ncbi:MAG: Inner membrane protein YrbG [Chloroflexi bacterium ADurb.Bin360]|nr:MAG: Inner membrane protein YrbG [Chloroflexi bacterium ADurb.Bin360]